jgi:hypothetical protein
MAQPRQMTLQLTTTGGTLFGVDALLNGYHVIPSDESDPDGWHGTIPATSIPLDVGATGVAGSTYTIDYQVTSNGATQKQSIPRTIPQGGIDAFHGTV